MVEPSVDVETDVAGVGSLQAIEARPMLAATICETGLDQNAGNLLWSARNASLIGKRVPWPTDWELLSLVC